MFGFEILDVVIGLVFVYLLLSLFATALNEYIAAVLNLRGKELARGLYRLLDDVDEKGAVTSARDGLTSRNREAGLLTEQLYAHPLIHPLASRQGWIARDWPYFWRRSREPRLPSYIPARTFAMALLDVLGVKDPDAPLHGGGGSTTAGYQAQADQPDTLGSGLRQKDLLHVLEMFKRQSPADVSQARDALAKLLGSTTLGVSAQMRLLDALTASETQLQKLQESVEVWFNDAMDRVSGAYKRTAQGWLFLLGVLIAGCMNADTIDMWRRLQADDDLRAAMVRRAEATVAAMDSTRADSAAAAVAPPAGSPSPSATANAPAGSGADTQTVTVTSTATSADSAVAAAKQARENYLAARARLDSMELDLGWSRAEAVRVGLLRRDPTEDTVPPASKPSGQADGATSATDSVAPKPGWVPAGYDLNLLFPFTSQPGFFKLLGLLLTAVAISLGAPFWFDLLNKVISIRAAGPAPDERPKPPEAAAKRMAERAPR